jgi:hypothetical protein
MRQLRAFFRHQKPEQIGSTAFFGEQMKQYRKPAKVIKPKADNETSKQGATGENYD